MQPRLAGGRGGRVRWNQDLGSVHASSEAPWGPRAEHLVRQGGSLRGRQGWSDLRGAGGSTMRRDRGRQEEETERGAASCASAFAVVSVCQVRQVHAHPTRHPKLSPAHLTFSFTCIDCNQNQEHENDCAAILWSKEAFYELLLSRSAHNAASSRQHTLPHTTRIP